MFYKFATAFACFFVLGQAMADEHLAGPDKGTNKGNIAEPGTMEPNVGPGKPAEPNIGPGPSEPNVGPGPSEPNLGPGPSEPNLGPGPSEPNVGPGKSAEPNIGPGPSEPNIGPGPSEPNVGPGKPVEPNLGPGTKGPETTKGPGPRTEFPVVPLTFDQLKLACEDPAQFHFQLQPDNIRIACASRETRWVPNGDGGLQLECTRIVAGELYSNKVRVEQEVYAVPVPPNSLSCPSFKEIEMIYASQYGTTCEEILGYNDLGHFCQERLTSDPNAIPELVEVRDTGRLVDTCPGANMGPAK